MNCPEPQCELNGGTRKHDPSYVQHWRMDEPQTPLIYLACPYWHVDPAVRQSRFDRVTVVAAKLMVGGTVVFSPITHGHPMHLAHDMPGDWPFWRRVDRTFLQRSSELFVLMLDGWRQSVGVTAEIKMAEEEFHIPVMYIDGSERFGP